MGCLSTSRGAAPPSSPAPSSTIISNRTPRLGIRSRRISCRMRCRIRFEPNSRLTNWKRKCFDRTAVCTATVWSGWRSATNTRETSRASPKRRSTKAISTSAIQIEWSTSREMKVWRTKSISAIMVVTLVTTTIRQLYTFTSRNCNSISTLNWTTRYTESPNRTI